MRHDADKSKQEGKEEVLQKYNFRISLKNTYYEYLILLEWMHVMQWKKQNTNEMNWLMLSEVKWYYVQHLQQV